MIDNSLFREKSNELDTDLQSEWSRDLSEHNNNNNNVIECKYHGPSIHST